MERRIQLVEIIDADAGEVGHDLEVDLAAGRDRHEIGLDGDVAELQPVAPRIGHQAAHREQLRDVAARLAGSRRCQKSVGRPRRWLRSTARSTISSPQL